MCFAKGCRGGHLWTCLVAAGNPCQSVCLIPVVFVVHVCLGGTCSGENKDSFVYIGLQRSSGRLISMVPAVFTSNVVCTTTISFRIDDGPASERTVRALVLSF